MGRTPVVMSVFLLVLVLLLASRTGIAILHEHLSFDPPFLDMDHFGKRTVGFEWDLSGDTKTMKNFVRLTPDKQSQKGAVWSVDSIGSAVFASVLEFRISGKGDRFFGDGLAFWIVEPERKHSLADYRYGHYYYDDWGGGWGGGLKELKADLPCGDFHGFVETFKGVGVIVDTYRNEEFFSSHKDVAVVINTGNLTQEEMVTASVGCNAQVRYYENRGDFDPGAMSSRLKVEISGNILTVKVDPKNTKTWTDCAEVELPEAMGVNWTTGSHIGLSASTGQLSDNHDVIRLETFVSSEAARKGEANRENKQPMEIQPSIPFLERMTQMETVLNAMLVKMELMEHQQEHNVAKVEEFVKELFDKTTANERGLESSLDILERKVKELEIKIKRQLETTLEDGLGAATAAARGWRLPFVILLLVVSGGVFASYKVYRNLRKSHFF